MESKKYRYNAPKTMHRAPCAAHHGQMVPHAGDIIKTCDNSNRRRCKGTCILWIQWKDYQARCEKLSEETRWHRGSPAEVSHPKYGSIVVPHQSPLAALENAAALWGVHWTDIRDATVKWVPPDTPVETPWNSKRNIHPA